MIFLGEVPFIFFSLARLVPRLRRFWQSSGRPPPPLTAKGKRRGEKAFRPRASKDRNQHLCFCRKKRPQNKGPARGAFWQHQKNAAPKGARAEMTVGVIRRSVTALYSDTWGPVPGNSADLVIGRHGQTFTAGHGNLSRVDFQEIRLHTIQDVFLTLGIDGPANDTVNRTTTCGRASC